jgi:hypothetical protein
MNALHGSFRKHRQAFIVLKFPQRIARPQFAIKNGRRMLSDVSPRLRDDYGRKRMKSWALADVLIA